MTDDFKWLIQTHTSAAYLRTIWLTILGFDELRHWNTDTQRVLDNGESFTSRASQKQLYEVIGWWFIKFWSECDRFASSVISGFDLSLTLNSRIDLVNRDTEILARVESLDNGKPFSVANAFDVPQVALTFQCV